MLCSSIEEPDTHGDKDKKTKNEALNNTQRNCPSSNKITSKKIFFLVTTLILRGCLRPGPHFSQEIDNEITEGTNCFYYLISLFRRIH